MVNKTKLHYQFDSKQFSTESKARTLLEVNRIIYFDVVTGGRASYSKVNTVKHEVNMIYMKLK